MQTWSVKLKITLKKRTLLKNRLYRNPHLPFDPNLTHTRRPVDFPYEVGNSRKETDGRLQTREPGHIPNNKLQPNGMFLLELSILHFLSFSFKKPDFQLFFNASTTLYYFFYC